MLTDFITEDDRVPATRGGAGTFTSLASLLPLTISMTQISIKEMLAMALMVMFA